MEKYLKVVDSQFSCRKNPRAVARLELGIAQILGWVWKAFHVSGPRLNQGKSLVFKHLQLPNSACCSRRGPL